MYKQVVVLTDHETAVGYQLAGAKVKPVLNADEARTELLALLDNPSVGLIAVTEDFGAAIDEPMQLKMDKNPDHLVILVPSGSRLTMGAMQQKMLQKLIRNAIGFDLQVAS